MTSPLEQKKIKITGPSVVTANRTWDGAVVYRTTSQDWSTALAEAAVVNTSDDARALLAESVSDDVGAAAPHAVERAVQRVVQCSPDRVEEVVHELRDERRPIDGRKLDDRLITTSTSTGRGLGKRGIHRFTLPPATK